MRRVLLATPLPDPAAGRRPLASVRTLAPAATVVVVCVALLVREPSDGLTLFATVFLGIFFEALPFLLLGVLVSALVQEFVPPSLVTRLVPRGRLRAALMGAVLAVIFPVCECGVVPVARRLLDKGASFPAALSFMLAGPVVNPIVFGATWAAFGLEFAGLRLGTSLLMAVAVAWLYGFHPRPETVAARVAPSTEHPTSPAASLPAPQHANPLVGQPSFVGRLLRALEGSGDELLEMGRYLVVGAAAAALLRTVVSGPTLLAAGQGPLVAVPLMMALAALLSICSVVDAFVALSFTGMVSSGALLAFLVYGPVVDLKSILLYGTVLRWRTVLMLVILLTQLALLVGLAVSLHVG